MKNGFEIFTKMLVLMLILFLLCFAVFSFVTKARDIYEADKNVVSMKYLDTGLYLQRSFNRHEKSSSRVNSSSDDYDFLQMWLIINDW